MREKRELRRDGEGKKVKLRRGGNRPYVNLDTTYMNYK